MECMSWNTQLFIYKISATDTKYFPSETKYILFVPKQQVETHWHIDQSVVYSKTVKPFHCKLDGKNFETQEKIWYFIQQAGSSHP